MLEIIYLFILVLNKLLIFSQFFMNLHVIISYIKSNKEHLGFLVLGSE